MRISISELVLLVYSAWVMWHWSAQGSACTLEACEPRLCNKIWFHAHRTFVSFFSPSFLLGWFVLFLFLPQPVFFVKTFLSYNSHTWTESKSTISSPWKPWTHETSSDANQLDWPYGVTQQGEVFITCSCKRKWAYAALSWLKKTQRHQKPTKSV